MKILFVDDEEAVLSGLRRMLYRFRGDGWEPSFAVGGEAGLSRLKDEQFDVVVTDMRMPGIDGTMVLNVLREQYPQTVRIVLSGHTEQATALRTVPLAHQILSKPCSPEELQSVVNRATRLQSSLLRTQLLPVVGGIDALPSPPAVIIALNKALAEDDIEIERIVELVEGDSAISAKLLQLVNSAFFGVPKSVGDVATAVRYLGIATVRDLAVAVHAFQAVDQSSKVRGLVEAIQTHSTAVAEMTRLLMGDRRDRNEAFMAGMLHDIGGLVLASKATDQLLGVMETSRLSDRPLHEVEREVFGASHAEIGGYFLSMWGLPYPLIEVVVSHHDDRPLALPLSAGDATYLAQTLLHRYGNDDRWHEGAVPPPLPPEILEWDIVREALDTWNA